jgi:hypothetical protein
MAGKSTTLAIKIVSDNQAKPGLNAAAAEVDGFGSKLGKVNAALTATMAGIGLLGKASVSAASDAQQNAGAVEAVFGKYASGIEKTAGKAATTVGLSTSAYEQMAAVLGSQLANAGYSGDVLAGKVNSLIVLGSDLAAVYGGTTADAIEALSSTLKGETDPIERYGVSIKQADINAVLAANHQDKLTGTAGKMATANAALTLITQQTSAAHGQFAIQTDSLAEKQQIMNATWADTKANLGTGLLPVMGLLVDASSAVGGWMGQNTTLVGGLTIGILALVAGTKLVNGVMAAYEAGVKVAAAAQWLLNIAMDANPIMLIVLAIAAVIAILVVCYIKFQAFRDFLAGFWFAFTIPYQAVKAGLDWLDSKIQGLPAPFRIAFAVIKNVIEAVMNPIAFVVDKVKWLLDKGGAVAALGRQPVRRIRRRRPGGGQGRLRRRWRRPGRGGRSVRPVRRCSRSRRRRAGFQRPGPGPGAAHGAHHRERRPGPGRGR